MYPTSVISSQRWPWLILALLIVVLLMGVAFTTVSQASTQANLITGLITDPHGDLPPSGTIVQLIAPPHTIHGAAAVDVSGAFSLGPIPNGNYVLQAKAPIDSGLTPSLPHMVMMTGSSIDVGTMALTFPTITGTVYAPDGTTPVTATVRVYRSGHLVQSSPAQGGEIRLGGLLSGTYAIQAEPLPREAYWRSERLPATVSPGVTQTIDLVLRPANVVGTVVDPNGTPVPGARAHVVGVNSHVYRSDLSGSNGLFAIGDLITDTYWLVVDPPWASGGMIASRAITFSVPPEFTDVGDVALRSAPKIVKGSVRTNNGLPVQDALVLANRLGFPGRQETLTAVDGSYTLTLSAGPWSLTVRHSPTSQPAEWAYPYPPRLVYFGHNLQPEVKHVNFQVLTADSEVIGEVKMPDGVTSPPFTVTVALRNDEGIGRQQVLPPGSSAFSIRVPNGNYILHARPEDPGYAGPPPQRIYAPVSDTLDVGVLTLLERDATISGTVTNEDGDGVGDVFVVGWTREHVGAQTRTNPDGRYLLAVPAGDWLVKPRVPPEMPYVYVGRPLSVTVASMDHVTGTDFVLTAADNVVAGQLVDPSGQPVNASGWAAAVNSSGPVNGAPIEGGTFSIYLPDGQYQVDVHLAAGSEWLVGGPQLVTVAGGETVSLTVPLLPKNATVKAALWDPREKIVPIGVKGQVSAHNPFAWVSSDINPANGTADLGLSAGLWLLGYRVDPASGYVALDHHKVVPLESGQTLGVPLPVAKRDGIIRGIVRRPNGQPLPGAVVAADGIGGQIGQVTLRTRSDENGLFRLAVPYGNYRVRAAHERDPGWLNPVDASVQVPLHGVVNVDLQFRSSDVTLSGVVTLESGLVVDGRVHIWAYSNDGAATHTTVPLGDTYQLGLLSNTRWHVGAVLERSDSFYAVRTVVKMGSGNETLDLVLKGPFPKPGAVVTTFDASAPQVLELADGTQIFIPAGAMPVSGTVTLHITPIATFPHQNHAHLYKYGYAFVATDETGEPITSNFNQDVIIRFSYEEAELRRLGLREAFLKPAYFSTSTQSWTIPDSYVVDTEANVVTLQIDHFTDFSLLNGAVQESYLPVISR